MVAWSLRCERCRQQKVKCDQRWPTCGRCAKSKKKCSGPPDFVRFVEGIVKDDSTPSDSGLKFTSSKTSPTGSGLLVPMTVGSSDVGIFHTWKQTNNTRSLLEAYNRSKRPLDLTSNSPSPPPVSKSYITELRDEFIRALEVQEQGPNLRHVGAFMSYVPAMLEHSPALCAAAACCLVQWDAELRGVGSVRSHQRSRLYGKALTQLHKTLQNETETSTIPTLLAAIIMSRIEMSTTPHPHLHAGVLAFSFHTNGIRALLECCDALSDDAELELGTLMAIFGPIVTQAVVCGEKTFLGRPNWRELFQRNYPSAHQLDKIRIDLFTASGYQPLITKKLRDLEISSATNQELGFGELDNLYQQIREYYDMASGLNDQIDSLLEHFIEVTQSPSTAASRTQFPIPEVYRLEGDVEYTTVILLHALTLLCAINCLVDWHALHRKQLHDSEAASSSNAPDLQEQTMIMLKQQSRWLSKRVWMFFRQVQRIGLLIVHYYPLAMIMTIPDVESDDELSWVVGTLNMLQGQGERTDDTDAWTAERALLACQAVNGHLAGPFSQLGSSSQA